MISLHNDTQDFQIDDNMPVHSLHTIFYQYMAQSYMEASVSNPIIKHRVSVYSG